MPFALLSIDNVSSIEGRGRSSILFACVEAFSSQERQFFGSGGVGGGGVVPRYVFKKGGVDVAGIYSIPGTRYNRMYSLYNS